MNGHARRVLGFILVVTAVLCLLAAAVLSQLRVAYHTPAAVGCVCGFLAAGIAALFLLPPGGNGGRP